MADNISILEKAVTLVVFLSLIFFWDPIAIEKDDLGADSYLKFLSFSFNMEQVLLV